jgi:hypothetical protein
VQEPQGAVVLVMIAEAIIAVAALVEIVHTLLLML